MTAMPAAFIGHGSPMNALESNRHTQAWRAFGAALPRPRAVLAISAHWYIPAVAATAMAQPKTIHDFGGFPPALHAFQYPAPGDPALADELRALLAPVEVHLDTQWGLDHGTWSVLAHVFPDADLPVVQLSIDSSQPPQFHYDLGQRLAALRESSVLILGLGNVVHNLGLMQWSGSATPLPWATQFNDAVRGCIAGGEHTPLVDYASFGQAAKLSVPTPEHYLPSLYIAGAQVPQDRVEFITDGIESGSISMLSWTAT